MKIVNIQKAVCEHFNIELDDMVGPSQADHLILPRNIAIHISLMLSHSTTRRVAARFNRNHTTIVVANRKLRDKLRRDSDLRMIVQDIINEVRISQTLTLDEMIARNLERKPA